MGQVNRAERSGTELTDDTVFADLFRLLEHIPPRRAEGEGAAPPDESGFAADEASRSRPQRQVNLAPSSRSETLLASPQAGQ